MLILKLRMFSKGGLLRDIHELRAAAELSGDPEVHTKGIYQSIGGMNPWLPCGDICSCSLKATKNFPHILIHTLPILVVISLTF